MLSDSLAKELMAMDIDEAIPLTRACGHYLNLVRELRRCSAAAYDIFSRCI